MYGHVVGEGACHGQHLRQQGARVGAFQERGVVHEVQPYGVLVALVHVERQTEGHPRDRCRRSAALSRSRDGESESDS